jgi:hypothetical protein
MLDNQAKLQALDRKANVTTLALTTKQVEKDKPD